MSSKLDMVGETGLWSIPCAVDIYRECTAREREKLSLRGAWAGLCTGACMWRLPNHGGQRKHQWHRTDTALHGKSSLYMCRST